MARRSTTVVVHGKCQVTVPESVRKLVPIKNGDKVLVSAKNGDIIIRPIIEIPKSQAWFWSKEWQEKEKRSEADRKAGRYRVFKSVKALKKALGV